MTGFYYRHNFGPLEIQVSGQLSDCWKSSVIIQWGAQPGLELVTPWAFHLYLLSCMGVQAHACRIHAHMHVCTYRGQRWTSVFFLRQHPSIFLETGFLIGLRFIDLFRMAYQWASGNLPVPTTTTLWFIRVCHLSLLCTWVLRIKIRSSCLHDLRIADWAISKAATFHLCLG